MKIEKPILFFIVCLTSLSVLDLLFNYFHFFSGNIWTSLFILNVAIILVALLYLINNFHFESIYFKIMFFVFYGYQLAIIIRGLDLSYNNIKFLLTSDYIFWPFVLPLFVFFNKKTETLVQLIKLMYYLGICFLLVCMVYPSLIYSRATAEIFIHPFAFGCGFLLMNSNYLSRKKVVFSFIITLISILAFSYLARRNAIVTFTGFTIAALYLYLKNVSASGFIKAIPILGLIMLLPFFVMDKIPTAFTKNLVERFNEDSRSVVFAAFFKGMQGQEYFGKGMSGTYYCPIDAQVLDDGGSFSEEEHRTVIENGYLQLMLNGGYTQIILFVLVLLPAAFLGIFKSSNTLTKACGLLILLWLFDMGIYGMPRLVLEYVFVWISVGICYKRSFRERSEEEIYEVFENYNLA